MKYPIIISLVAALAVVAGCEEETPTTTTSSSSSGSGGSAGEGGSAGSGGGTAGNGGSAGGGMGGGGMGGSGGGGMGGSGGGMGGAGGGSSAVCDNPTVVDKTDAAMRCQNLTEVVKVVMAPANTVWADKVDGVSTEYGPENYGAKQALGAPNVYPASGDEPNAWATSMEDAMGEFITVGFSTPVVAEAVWVFETYNPGAISKITVTAADGDHVVYEASPMAGGFGACGHVLSASTKTCSPISAVRVDLASDKVLGFNEIDAIGLIPAAMK